MTVGSTTVSTLAAGRVDDALADIEKYKALLARHGAQNIRNVLLMSSTPLRLATTYEAEDQAALGKIADSLLADPQLQELMGASYGPGGTSTGYVTETWIEL